MRKLAIAVALVLLAGCSSSTPVADALLVGMVGYSAVEYSRDPHPFPSFSSIYEFGNPPAPAPLDPKRKVLEQDCSKPLQDPTANLKCR
ncbi:MAG TPA: hypothetical protein VF943_13490 [Burkholderiales bacterium]